MWSWILYDFANTIFSMNVVSMYFALWITVDNALDDFWVGLVNSLSMLLVAVTLPILGVISDIDGRRVPFLAAMTLMSCLATALMGGVAMLFPAGIHTAIAALLLYTIANYAYQGGLVFYNALLPVVSTRWSMGRISGYGVAFGYLGAIFGLMMVEPFVSGVVRGVEVPLLMGKWHTVCTIGRGPGSSVVDFPAGNRMHTVYRFTIRKGDSLDVLDFEPDSVTVDQNGSTLVYWNAAVLDSIRLARGGGISIELEKRREGYGRSAAFLPTAVLFLLFSLPIFYRIKEERMSPLSVDLRRNIGLAFHRIRDALLDTGKYPGVRRFLVAKYLYEDAIATVIVFMGVYSVRVIRMENDDLITFFIISTTSAMAGGLLTGTIVDRIGARRILHATLLLWTASLVVIALLSNTALFWVMGSVVGVCLGATWTSARPFFVGLVPEGMLGEFFGLYSLSGKLAAIIGPLLWGLLVYLLNPYGTIAYRVAILSLAGMALAGFLVLRGVGKGEE